MDFTSVIDQSLSNAGLTDSEGVEIESGGSEPAIEASEPVAETPEATPEAGAPADGDPAPPADPVASAPTEPVAPVVKKKQGAIPTDKHEKILSNERAKHKTEFDALSARFQNVAWAEHPEAKARVQAMGAAETHPEIFAQAMLGDAKLGPIFRKLIGAPAAAPAAPAAVGGGDRPKPNVTDKDGNPAYDEAGLEALLNWTAAQGAALAQKAFEAKYGTEIEPLVKERKAKAAWNADVQRADAHINEARRTWFGFTDAEPLIKKFLLDKANVNKSLFDAYMAVVVNGKLKTDRAAMRTEILAEMNGKAKIAQPKPAAVGATPATGKNRSMTEVINDAIAGLE